MASSLRVVSTIENNELLSAMPTLDYCNYTRRCSGCYDALRFLKMGVNENSSSIYDRQGRSKDSYAGAHVRWWRSLRR